MSFLLKLSYLVTISLLIIGFNSGSLADAGDLAKQANKLVRQAERKFFSGKSNEADTMLIDVRKLLDQASSEEPGNKKIQGVEYKYNNLRKKVDRRLGTTGMTPPHHALVDQKSRPESKHREDSDPGNESTREKAAPKSAGGLPSAVASRIRKINKELDKVEKGQTNQLKSAARLFKEIESRYAAKFDPTNPDFVAAEARFDELTARAEAAEKAKLPPEVDSLLYQIGRELDILESRPNTSMQSATRLFNELDNQYGDNFDHNNPSYIDIKKRYVDIGARVAAAEKAAKQAAAVADADKVAADAQNHEWEARFQAYLAYPGNEGHDPSRLVFVPGTSSPERAKYADARRRFEDFKRFYQTYQQTVFSYKKSWKLKDLAENKAPLRIREFEETFADRLDSAEAEASSQIAAAMAQLDRDNGWRSDQSVLPPLIDSRRKASIKAQVDSAVQALGVDSDKSRQLQQAYAEMIEKDRDNREMRKQRTFMIADRYHDADSDAIRVKARSLVAQNRNEGGEPLRVTIISENWKETSQWEWTDTTRTQRRFRTTRNITAQVAAKAADGIRLITVAIARDKQSDGSWGPLYGNLHQGFDPMTEENVYR